VDPEALDFRKHTDFNAESQHCPTVEGKVPMDLKGTMTPLANGEIFNKD
jgi:hypothetical protein